MPVDRTTLEQVTRAILDRSSRLSPSPELVTLLLRFFIDTGDVCAVAPTESAIVGGLAALAGEPDGWRRLSWMRALDEAASCMESPALAEQLARELPAVVDGVEADVRRLYEPGVGLVGASPLTHARAVLALLDGFDLTGRLPYAMLAEELMGAARRLEAEGVPSVSTVVGRSTLARALCRIAALRRSPEYVARSVPAAPRDAAGEAGQWLAGIDPATLDLETDGPAYALALAEWLALHPDLQ